MSLLAHIAPKTLQYFKSTKYVRKPLKSHQTLGSRKLWNYCILNFWSSEVKEALACMSIYKIKQTLALVKGFESKCCVWSFYSWLTIKDAPSGFILKGVPLGPIRMSYLILYYHNVCHIGHWKSIVKLDKRQTFKYIIQSSSNISRIFQNLNTFYFNSKNILVW